MRDQELYNKIKQFCKDGIEYASKQLAKLGNKAPTKIAESFLIVDDHTTSHNQEIVTDWSWLILDIEKGLQKLGSYKQAAFALNNHKVFGHQLNTLIGTSDSMRRLETDELLRISLASILMENNEATFNEKQFDAFYKKVESYFYAKIFRYRYFSPISNFSMEQDHLELAPNFAIVKITKEEKEKLLSTSSAFHSTYPILASKEYAFEFISNQPKVIGKNQESLEKRLQPQQEADLWFRTAISALRLYKLGLIGFNHVWTIDTGWEFQGIRSISSKSGPSDYLGDHIRLDSSETPEFLELWGRYRKISQRNLKKILNSVARLNFGTERSRAEDKLIDYFIGFESLFLNNDSPELKYRLSVSIAYWLGTDFTERKKIFEIIGTGYDQRSKIVHGGNPKQTVRISGVDISFVEHTKLIEDYLRSAIKKFIVLCTDNNKNETQLTEELRDKILQ